MSKERTNDDRASDTFGDHKSADTYAEKVAGELIAQLEKGVAPWQKPWVAGELQQPMNPTTGKAYRGMNSLWLTLQSRADPRWMTYKQAGANGAQVRKGEKGTLIQYAKMREEKALLDAEGNPVLDSDGQPKTYTVQLQRPRVFCAVVFNGEQIDGLPPLEKKPVLAPEWERHARVEAILAGSGVPIDHVSGNGAYYAPKLDRITLPERGQFPSADAYYSTALHELGHATGHVSRLNRDLHHPYLSAGYAKEELRAEIASLMLGQRLDIGHDPEQHAAYVETWIKVLRDDPREIFRAAADAEKITGFVLDLENPKEQRIPQQQVGRAADDAQSTSEESAMPTTERIDLVVPFKDKDQAKVAGARWDKDQKTWYAPQGSEISPLTQWLPENQRGSIEEPVDPRTQFADVLAEAKFLLPGEPIMDGTRQRVPVEGDEGSQRSGSYIAWTDGRPAGSFQNYRTGLDEKWKATGKAGRLSDAERKKLHDEAAEKLAAREAAANARYARVGAALEQLYEAMGEPVTDHPYLERKGLLLGAHTVPAATTQLPEGSPLRIAATPAEAHALRKSDPDSAVLTAGDLLIPIRDVNGKAKSAQTINADGLKGFVAGGEMRGGMYQFDFPVGKIYPGNPVFIAEGYATAMTIGEHTGASVAVAFTAGNLKAVAVAIREKYPDRAIVIAGDNDHGTAKEIDPRTGKPKENRGLVAANEAAEAVGGYAAIPRFTNPKSKGTDWNDYLKEEGEQAMQNAMSAAMLLADRRRLEDAHRLGHDAERIGLDIRQHQASAEIENSGGPELANADIKTLAAGTRNAADREIDRQDKSDELGNGQPDLEQQPEEPDEGEKKPKRARGKERGRAVAR